MTSVHAPSAGFEKMLRAWFDQRFGRWGIRLPDHAHGDDFRGRIVHAGWDIWYCAGIDEQGEYLDFYAIHRMTNDRHVRLRSNGASINLPAIRDMRRGSFDPDEDRMLEDAYRNEVRTIHAMLRAKGFLRWDESETGCVTSSGDTCLVPMEGRNED